METSHKKMLLILLNIFLLFFTWHMSGLGIFVGKTGNLGSNCNYLTSRGLFDQQQVIANTLKFGVPHAGGCPLVYSFDVWDH